MAINAISDKRKDGLLDRLSDARFAIGGVYFDALLLWGIPIIALLFVTIWTNIAARLPEQQGQAMLEFLTSIVAVLTFAHLFAVIPRAYFNREVYESNRFKLTVVPLLLLTGLVVSPVIFAIGGAAALLWDVHHSAMQNFGIARIYDMKVGNDAHLLRKVDLRLNWVLYVGPLLAGGSLMWHLHAVDRLKDVGLVQIANLPGVLESEVPLIRLVAIVAWLSCMAWAAFDYRVAIKAGYQLPAHKVATITSTGIVSLMAWGYSSPYVALAAINIYHAIQYFALVWLKEGNRISEVFGKRGRTGLILFLAACTLAGFAYSSANATNIEWIIAPFIACSLLHFWFDGFVWSVRKKQV